MPKRISTATAIIGVPGAGKTSLIESAAMYGWETYRKVLCLYSWDGGAIPTRLQKRIRQGLIRFFRARSRSDRTLAVETVGLSTKGYWPKEINPETGETSPAVELVPPLTVRYTVTCAEGHALQVIPALSLQRPMLCPTCMTLAPLETQRVQQSVTRTRGFEDIGLVAFDSLTSMSDVATDFMDHERGQGRIGGEKSAFGGIVRSGSEVYGGNNRADVGFAQTRAQQWVNNSLSIPGLVEGPIFTSLTHEVSDEGLSVVGFKLKGSAAADQATAWFGQVMEMGRSLDDKGQEHYTLYLRPYIDQQGRRHLLKTPATPFGLPDKLVDPIEAPYTVANLGAVFAMLDTDLEKELSEELKDGPGAPPTSYGEAVTVQPAAASTAAAAAPASASSTIPTLVSPPTPPTAKSATVVAPPVPARKPTAPPTPAVPPSPVVAPPAVTATAPPPPGMRPPARAPQAEGK